MDGYADDLAALIEALAGGPFHRRRRSRAIHRPPRNEPSRQGRPDCRSTTPYVEDRRQS
jgi:hypothetical protein